MMGIQDGAEVDEGGGGGGGGVIPYLGVRGIRVVCLVARHYPWICVVITRAVEWLFPHRLLAI